MEFRVNKLQLEQIIVPNNETRKPKCDSRKKAKLNQEVSIRMSSAQKRRQRLDRGDRAKLVASLEKKIEKRA